MPKLDEVRVPFAGNLRTGVCASRTAEKQSDLDAEIVRTWGAAGGAPTSDVEASRDGVVGLYAGRSKPRPYKTAAVADTASTDKSVCATR